jgi:hypothetical protein
MSTDKSDKAYIVINKDFYGSERNFWCYSKADVRNELVEIAKFHDIDTDTQEGLAQLDAKVAIKEVGETYPAEDFLVVIH